MRRVAPGGGGGGRCYLDKMKRFQDKFNCYFPPAASLLTKPVFGICIFKFKRVCTIAHVFIEIRQFPDEWTRQQLEEV